MRSALSRSSSLPGPSSSAVLDLLEAAARATEAELDPQASTTAAEMLARGGSTGPALDAALRICGFRTEGGLLGPRELQKAAGAWMTSWTREGRVMLALASSPGNKLELHVADGLLGLRRLEGRVARAFVQALGVSHWVKLERALPLEPIREAADWSSPWTRARRYLAIDRNDLWVVTVYAVAIGGLSLVTPVAVQALVTNVAFGTALQPVVILTILVAAGLTFSAVLRVLQSWVIEVLQQRFFVRTLADLSRRLPRVRLSAWDRIHGPELTNRFLEIVAIQKSTATLLFDGLGLLLQTIVGFALLAAYHPVLLAFDVFLVLGLAIVVFVLGRGAFATGLAESSAKYRSLAWLESVAGSPVVFKSSVGANLAASRADMLSREYLRARRAHFRKILNHIVGGLAIQVVASALLLGIGGWLVLKGQLSLGQLVAAELVVTTLGAGFAKLGSQLEKVYDLVVAVAKTGRLVDLPVDRKGGEPLVGEGSVGLTLRDVEWMSERSGGPVTAPDLEARPGERVAIVSDARDSGSELLEVIAGFRESSKGRVELDGHRVELLNPEDVGTAVALIREGDFVGGTVLENLRLARPDLDLDGAMEVAAAVGLDLEALGSDGLSTPIHPGGRPLPLDARRRLGLARALVRRPRLLLVDGLLDGLSAEDPAVAAVLGEDADWTTIVVTRDPRIESRCDQRATFSNHHRRGES